jgi:SWI/SNF-related matrix-associated actin-dependent regulator of chromatin subfamily A3
LQNDITDIATLFKFLRLEPLNTKQNFDRHITAKWKAGDASGMKTLRDVLRQICLRRAKETISDRLPTRTVNIKYLDFNNRERILYDSHKDKLSSVVKSACDSTFQVLLRLRLICDHGKDLLPRGDVEIRCSTCDMQLRDWEMDAGQISNIRAVPEDRDTPSPGCGLCARVQENIGTAFPNYQGPSTKVQALIDSIKTCTSEDIMNREPVSKQ